MGDFLKEKDSGLCIFPNTNSYQQKELSKYLLMMIDGAGKHGKFAHGKL